MTELDFDVHFGPVNDKKINWRDVLTADEPDDDEELDVTPDDVIGLLGFDPKEFSEETITKGGPGSGSWNGPDDPRFAHEGNVNTGSFGKGVLNLTPEQMAANKTVVDQMNKDIFAPPDIMGVSQFNKKQVQKQIADQLEHKDEFYTEDIPGLDSFFMRGLQREFVEGYVRESINEWASTSGDTEPGAVATQLIAERVFKLGDTAVDHYGDEALKGAQKLLDDPKFVGRKAAFLQAQYDATQKYFKDNNIKEIILYRGVEHKDSGKLREETIQLQPISSFSVNALEARSFAKLSDDYIVGDDGIHRPPSNAGTLYASVIPVEKILSHPRTGFGCTKEGEIVVLGGKMKVTIIPTQIAWDVNTTVWSKPFPGNTVYTDYNGRFLETLDRVTPEFREKAMKKESPYNIDANLNDADWVKQSWDLPEYGSKEFNEYLKSSGMTLEKFKKLPVYQHAVEKGEIKKDIGLNTIFKIGNARSGNYGHSGRPGQVGGSGSGGGSETNSLFAKTDQEIRDIEGKQETITNDVFQRQLDVKDFEVGGKYQKLLKEQYGTTDADLLISQENEFTNKGGHSSLVAMVNKFDSQNALYDKLKDNKDFNKFADMHQVVAVIDRSAYETSGKISDEEFKEIVARRTIRDLVDQWSTTSGDTDPKAVAMQMAANELFGDGKVDHLTSQIALNTTLGPELKFNPGRKAFLQAQYDATQDYLKKNNIKEVILYRGHEGKRSKLDGGNDVEVNLQPLSSFSMDPNIAKNFADAVNVYGATPTRPSVIASIVPAKRIFALPNTGIGCTGEKEAVVLGGKTRSTVIAGIPKLDEVFTAQTVRSAIDIRSYMTPKNFASYPATSALLEGKTVKKAIPNLDEDLENADWTKRTWDLPKFGSKEFDQFLSASGMTLDHFKTLPVYRWMIESSLKVGKGIGLSGMYQKLSR